MGRADFPMERMTATRLRITGVDDEFVAGMSVHCTMALPFHDGTFENPPFEASIHGKEDGVAALKKTEQTSSIARRVIKVRQKEAAQKGVDRPPAPGGAGAGGGDGTKNEEAKAAFS